MDTTVKSGGDFAKQYLAPTWDMLSRYRSGGGEVEYTLEFLKHLNDNKEKIIATFTGFINKYSIRELILGCYCNKDKFCHRHLLYRFLLEHMSLLEPGGELTATSFEQVEGFNPIILSFDGEDPELTEACKQLIGNEYTLVDNNALPMEERRAEAIVEAHKAIARYEGPVLDKFGLFKGVDDLNIPIIEVETAEEIREHFFKRWPLPSPEKLGRELTEMMDDLYRQCSP